MQDISRWMSYVFEKLSDEIKISDFLNHENINSEIVFSRRSYRPFLKIAATVQDPNLPKIYQFCLDRISPEYEEARKDLINFYENDIAEISRIVAAKKQGN